jgi:hypothetical protein
MKNRGQSKRRYSVQPTLCNPPHQTPFYPKISFPLMGETRKKNNPKSRIFALGQEKKQRNCSYIPQMSIFLHMLINFSAFT